MNALGIVGPPGDRFELDKGVVLAQKHRLKQLERLPPILRLTHIDLSGGHEHPVTAHPEPKRRGR